MEIQAKITFSHGRIMRILDENGVSIKKLSVMCGWPYQDLQGFLTFRRLPGTRDYTLLLHVLQGFDPSITAEEVLCADYAKLREVLRPRKSIRDIPLENLLPYSDDILKIEDRTENAVALKTGVEKLLSIAKRNLPSRQYDILMRVYGLDGRKQGTYEEIGHIHNLTRERVRMIRENAEWKLRHNAKVKPLRELTCIETESEVVER